jgi:hypothetical protein
LAGQSVSAEVDITGSGIIVTEDPRTGERTITGTKITIVVRYSEAAQWRRSIVIANRS